MDKFIDLSVHDEIAFDTEATGLNPHAGDKVFGFSVSTRDKDLYWDIRETPEAVTWFNDQMARYKGTVICHNLSFDWRMSAGSGMNFNLANSVDTCINACLINEHEVSYSLDSLAKKYTNSFKKGDALYSELAKLFGGRATRNVQMKNISKAPSEIVAPYAKGDTRATFDLYQAQKEEIRRQSLERIVKFERQLTPVLVGAETRGVRVDTAAAERAVGELTKVIRVAQKELDDIAGFHCNPQPSGDIKKLFKPTWRDGKWWACDGTPLEPTAAGQPSIGADALRTMAHPAAAKILELRSLIKTRDTFLVGHVLESAVNGRVYPTINQTKGDDGGTGTGRLSYTTPALQQIPDRNKKVAEIVKSVFLPEEGHVWVDADMASFEVRMFAHLVGTPDIIEVYRKNPETDFHAFVSELTGLVRNATYNGQPNAKQLNLSMIFNQGDGTTADSMGMPWSWESFIPKNSRTGDPITYRKAGPEAKAVINKYHKHLPGVKRLAEGCKKVAEERGWIFTRYGRHLRFPRGYKSYKASGILIQATSADENKVNWLRIGDALAGTGGLMLLNTHDSYSLSLPKEDAHLLSKKVKIAVEMDRGLRVPLVLEVQEPGRTWWDSKSSNRWDNTW